MTSPTPYTINVSQDKIDQLKQKLSLATFPDELNHSDWDYGTPLTEVKRLVHYWQNNFDWKTQEAKLNELPNYSSKIECDGFESLDIHFIHQKSDSSNAIPLLFVHGWPGSYIEVMKLLPLLKGGLNQPSFDIVAPSLPNFAFSSGTKRKGFGLAQYAETCHKLMQQLGYPKYVTQGGDWGFYITRTIALLYPDAAKAHHINMIRASPPSFLSQPGLALAHAVTPYSDYEQKGLERSKWFAEEGSGYRVLQCTKPQTIGYALNDSPVALLAWITEKLHDWTDAYPWGDDELLTWISIYWFSTAGPAAASRIYYEATHDSMGGAAKGEVQGGFVSRERTQQWIGGGPKLGLAFFPRELSLVPVNWAYTMGDVAYTMVHERGGHFAAHEMPEAIAGDLKNMFGRGGPCFGIVEGKSGY